MKTNNLTICIDAIEEALEQGLIEALKLIINY